MRNEIAECRKKKKCADKSKKSKCKADCEKKVRKIKKQRDDSDWKKNHSDSDVNAGSSIVQEGSDTPDEDYELTPLSEFTSEDLAIGCYFLAKYQAKHGFKFYVGQVTEKDGDTCKATKESSLPLFTYPDNEDIDVLELECIVAILPPPQPIGGTQRASKVLKFDYNMAGFF